MPGRHPSSGEIKEGAGILDILRKYLRRGDSEKAENAGLREYASICTMR